MQATQTYTHYLTEAMGMQEPCQLFSLTLLLLCAAYVLSLIELIVTELHQNIILNYFSQQK